MLVRDTLFRLYRCYNYYRPRKRGDKWIGVFAMNLNDKEFVLLKEQLARIEVKLNDIPEIKADLKDYGSRLERQSEKSDKAYSVSMQNREGLADLKNSYTWLTRTTVGAVIGALVSIGLSLFMK